MQRDQKEQLSIRRQELIKENALVVNKMAEDKVQKLMAQLGVGVKQVRCGQVWEGCGKVRV